MAQDSSPDPRTFPLFSSPTIAEIQDALEESLARILWADGLEHIAHPSNDPFDGTPVPSIKRSLSRIADSLENLARQGSTR